MNNANVDQHIKHKQQLNQKSQKPVQKQARGQNPQQFNSAVQELCSMYDAVNYFGKNEYSRNEWREHVNSATACAIRNAPAVPKRRRSSEKQQSRPQQQQRPQQSRPQQQRPQQQKQVRGQNPQQQKQVRGQNPQQFNIAVQELCSMYDAVNYFGNDEYAKKNGWREINKQQLNTATIYSIRYAPVIQKRSQQQQRQQQQRQQQQRQQQPRQQQRQQQQQQQIKKQQPKQQNNRKQSGGRRIGGCQYKPNVPRVYSYNTTPLPSNLYPKVNDYNHLYEAFSYIGIAQVKNIKSWIESSRTHKLSSIASVFAKRNAPYVPVRQNRSNKRNQQEQRPQQKRQQIQKQQQQKNIPKQQSNKRQQKKQMINQEPLSNVWEEYYVSPRNSMFK